jgi:adenosine deaminase
LNAGVRCSLGADDPLILGVGLLDEYRIARDRLGFGDEHLAALARTSVANSSAPTQRIASWSAKIDAWLG